MNYKIDNLTKILKESNNIVFFGGAGMSTEYPIETHKNSYHSLTTIITIY